MDHTCVSGIKPSSVILTQTKYYRTLKRDAKILSKQVETKRSGEIKTLKIIILIWFHTEENLDVLKCYKST